MAETQPKTSNITLLVRLKEDVPDSSGDDMKESLLRLGFAGVLGVTTGKVVDLEYVEQLSPSQVDPFVKRIEAAGFLQHPLIETLELHQNK